MFSTFAGLRGAVSLILAQQLVLDQSKYPHEARVIAEVRTQNTAATFHCTLTITPTLTLCPDPMPNPNPNTAATSECA